MTQVTFDPVCGMRVDPATSTCVLEHDGTRYAFCGSGCLNKFKADPKRYLGNSVTKSSVAAAAVPGARYTCPMHPEVTQEGPGDCPKCRMALRPTGGIGAE